MIKYMARYSPLRYPGGKAKFIPQVQDIIKDNNLVNKIYIEPFCGGAAVALNLLIENFAKEIIINDYDYCVYAFWYSILNYTNDFIKLIQEVEINVENWNKFKKINQSYKENNYHILYVGFSTFFLNRTNRSGILKAGLIGGKEQKGEWKMNARFNRANLIARISKVSSFKDRIKLYNLDVIDFLDKIKTKEIIKDSFLYLDPPYYYKGHELYLNYFNHEDHLRIAEYMKNCKFENWIVSYDNCKEIKNLYSSVRQIEYNLKYSAGKNNNGEEILFYSDNLNICKNI